MIKKKKNEKSLNLQSKVRYNLNKLCDFNLNIVLNNVKTNSCFDFNKTSLTTNDNFIPTIDNSNIDIPKYKTKIINMNVNQLQSSILHKWFNSYIDMYNKVINFYIKNNIYDDVRNLKFIYDENKFLYLDMMGSKNEMKLLLKLKKKLNIDYDKILKKNKTLKEDKNKINEILEKIANIKIKIKNLNLIINDKYKMHCKSLSVKKTEYNKLIIKLNWKNLRTNHLKNIRDNIQVKSSDNNKLRIRIHILDCAIKNACTSYKLCVSNFLNNNIKKFKIRYWRHNKKNKIMEIEKEFIRNKELLKDVFGSLKYTYNNKEYKLTGNETVSILYASEIKKYYILVAEKIELKDKKSNKYIAIDQGIKPFMSSRTNNELINIGTNIAGLIGKYLKKINTINKTKRMNKKQQRKKEKKFI